MNAFRAEIKEPKDHLVLGLDKVTWGEAEQLINETSEYIGMYKINSLAQRRGWEHAVRTVASLGALTMADPKYFDTPDTVYSAVKDITTMGASLITVHAGGGNEMLEHAVQAREDGRSEIKDPYVRAKKAVVGGILAATVLTSRSEDDCQQIYGDSIENQVLRFTDMAAEAGADGVVCSAEEVKLIRERREFDDLLVVVASVTPSWTEKPDEHKRTGTPAQAIADGADLLFLGRKIRKPEQGMANSTAARKIKEEIEALRPKSQDSGMPTKPTRRVRRRIKE